MAQWQQRRIASALGSIGQQQSGVKSGGRAK